MLAITHEIFEQEIRGLGLPAALLTQSVKERALAVAVAKVSSQVDTDRRAAVAAIEAREGMPIRQLMMRQFMKHRPWLRIVLPHQFMPLTQVAPEIHMTVEHRVDEIKGISAEELWHLLATCVDENTLFCAGTYQAIIDDACRWLSWPTMRERIAGSIRKQSQCLRALAADTDECVVLLRPSKGGTHVTVSVMAGKAGARVPGRWN